jgi:hypothetical protein
VFDILIFKALDLLMASVLGFSDMLSLAQTVGMVGTMVLTLYFSKKQVQSRC